MSTFGDSGIWRNLQPKRVTDWVFIPDVDAACAHDFQEIQFRNDRSIIRLNSELVNEIGRLSYQVHCSNNKSIWSLGSVHILQCRNG